MRIYWKFNVSESTLPLPRWYANTSVLLVDTGTGALIRMICLNLRYSNLLLVLVEIVIPTALPVKNPSLVETVVSKRGHSQMSWFIGGPSRENHIVCPVAFKMLCRLVKLAILSDRKPSKSSYEHQTMNNFFSAWSMDLIMVFRLLLVVILCSILLLTVSQFSVSATA